MTFSRSKHGIKVFMLCDAESGYPYAFFIYTGAGEKTADMVFTKLLDGAMIGKGHIL